MRAAKKRDLSGLSFLSVRRAGSPAVWYTQLRPATLRPTVSLWAVGWPPISGCRCRCLYAVRCVLCTVLYTGRYLPHLPPLSLLPARPAGLGRLLKKVPPTVSAAAAFTAMRYSLHSQNKPRLVFACHLLSAISASKSRDSAVGSICCRQRWAVSSCQSAFCTVTSRSWLCHTNSCSCCRLSDRRVSVLPA